MKLLEQTYSSDGVTTHYWTAGRGEPLLFLSGGIRALTYQKNVEQLAKNFLVIIPDLPGFGRSSVPNDIWDLDDYALYFQGFITSLGLKQFQIVGHSLGGGIGLALATRSKNIKRIVLVGAAGVATTVPPWLFYFRIAVPKTIYDLRHAKNYKIQAIILFNGFLTLRTMLFGAHRLIKIIDKCVFHTYPHLKDVKIPVTLFWGDEDELFPFDPCALSMKRILPQCSLRTIEGNHDWCLLQPDKFTEHFMDAVSGRA